MKTFINGIGSVLIAGLCFIGARAVVQNIFESTENRNGTIDFDVVREEASQNGVSPVAAEQVISQMQNMADSSDLSEIEEAYGGITGTELQIRQKLNADPQRKEIVGRAMVNEILKYLELPIQLDEFTVATDIYYEAETDSVVYIYLITEDFSNMPDSFLEDLREELYSLNPDAQCKTSLSLLKQGFDMVYSYRNEAGGELFRITRSYEACQALGFS
mgnify:CR=1 FL=1